VKRFQKLARRRAVEICNQMCQGFNFAPVSRDQTVMQVNNLHRRPKLQNLLLQLDAFGFESFGPIFDFGGIHGAVDKRV
jgi:hypothetical protein